jgi:hypothetical protein
MKVSRCSAAQMIPLWPQPERGEPSIDARGREHGITAPTCDRWRTKGGGLTIPAAPRVREGAQEQARLTRLRAERDLAVDALKALLGQHSSRWRPAVRPSRSWVPVGSGRVAPGACGRGSVRRSSSRRAPPQRATLAMDPGCPGPNGYGARCTRTVREAWVIRPVVHAVAEARVGLDRDRRPDHAPRPPRRLSDRTPAACPQEWCARQSSSEGRSHCSWPTLLGADHSLERIPDLSQILRGDRDSPTGLRMRLSGSRTVRPE